MERTKPSLPKWRKIGQGSFRMKSGRIIKPNEVFSASPDDIPESFRNIIVPVEHLPKQEIKRGKAPVLEIKEVPEEKQEEIQKTLEDFTEEGSGEKPTALQQSVEEVEEGANMAMIPEIISAGSGWFDIINSVTGKRLNEKRLRKDAAEKLLSSMLQ